MKIKTGHFFRAFAAIFLASFSQMVHAQGTKEYGSGLKVDLDKEGSKYVRFIIWGQTWARSIENNPGTMVNGKAESSSWDIGDRRFRMLAYAQINPRFLVLTHFGINNQTFVNGGAAGSTGTGGYGQGKKPGIFIHDMYSEYAVFPEKDTETKKVNYFSLNLGAGLHYYNGISRMSSASTLNFLAIDAPIFNWPLIENSDQFARQFGIYVKGRVGKLNYQMNVSKPFATNITPTVANVAVDNNDGKMGVSGYFDYQFLEQESNLLPFRVGSYLGTKKVFNIGAGFYHNSNGTKSLAAGGVLNKHDINVLSVDAFAELPFGPKQKAVSLTAYSVLYNNNFGPNYLRNMGIMNLGVNDASYTGTRAMEGAGNARAMIGTGNIWYTQAGVLLPKFNQNQVTRIQPFLAYTAKSFEAHKENGNYYDIGANLLLSGHNAKITAQYSSRQLFDVAGMRMARKGEFAVQFQAYL